MCKIKGPYLPIGNIDWECLTHRVLANRVDGGWECPVTKEVRPFFGTD